LESKVGDVLEVEFVVNSGATDTVLPSEILERLGVQAMRSAGLRLANNGVIERPLREIGIEIEGQRTRRHTRRFRREGSSSFRCSYNGAAGVSS